MLFGKTFWFITMLFLGTAVAAQGQRPGRVVGSVHVAAGGPDAHNTDLPDHEVVVAALIRVLETPFSAQADQRGEFVIDSLPPGEYVVEARRIGFRPARQVIRVQPGEQVAIQLHLVPVPITVDALVIEALVDQGQRTYDLSALAKVTPVGTANVTTVTAEAIRQVHARDPWELVRSATGLEVHQQGQGPGFASDAVIRGFTSDHSADIALVVDGIPINEPVNGHGEGYADWNLLFPSAIADVQVVKGPISPLFGNFAAGGAVNVTTTASTDQTRLAVEGGSHLYTAGTLTTGLETGPWGAFLGAHGVRTDGWRENSGYNAGQAVARANRRFSPTVLLDGGLQLYRSKWNSPGYLSLDQFNQGTLTPAADPTDGGNTHRVMGRVAAAVTGPNLSWQTTAWGYRKYWHLFLTIPELGGAGEGLGQQTEELDVRTAFGARSMARWTLGPTEILMGLEGSRHRAKYSIYASVARTRDYTLNRYAATFMNGAAFASVVHTFGRVLRLEGAMRADLLRPTSTDQVTLLPFPAAAHTVVQPKLGAVWYARPDVQFYVSTARGFRSAPGTIGDPARRPVTEWAYEGGARFSLRRLSGSAAFFRLDTRNELVFNPVTLLAEKTGHSIREGLETEMHLRVARQLEIETHWTFNTKGVYFLPAAGTAGAPAPAAPLLRLAETAGTAAILHDEGNGERVAGVADYSGHVGLVVNPGRRFMLNLWTTFMGRYVPLGEPDARTEAYAIASLQAMVHFSDRVDLTFGLDNVLNARAPELRASGAINPVAPRTVHLSVGTDW